MKQDEPVIHSDPEIMGGTPVFIGTRVPLATMLDYLEAGQPLSEFLDDFPTVTREQAVAALEQAKEALLAAGQTLPLPPVGTPGDGQGQGGEHDLGAVMEAGGPRTKLTGVRNEVSMGQDGRLRQPRCATRVQQNRRLIVIDPWRSSVGGHHQSPFRLVVRT